MNTHHPTQNTQHACREVTRRITQETQKQTKSQQPHTNARGCQMLASTIHKTNNHHTPKPPPPTQGTAIHGSGKRQQPHTQQACGPVLPQPNSVPAHTHTPHTSTPSTSTLSDTPVQKFRSVPPMSTPHTHHGCQGLPQHTPQPTTHNVTVNLFGVCLYVLLLRKEVIQPHLPVRLPCYDLVPITGPTFDGSPHKG